MQVETFENKGDLNGWLREWAGKVTIRDIQFQYIIADGLSPNWGAFMVVYECDED